MFVLKLAPCFAAPAQPSSISGSVSVCMGSGPFNYSVPPISSADIYNWSVPAGWIGSGTSNTISSAPGSSGVFSITATNFCGTSPMQTLSVTVNPLPVLNAFSNTALICIGQTSTITASGASTYTWNTTTTTTAIAVSPSITTVYTVTGTDINGCMNSASFTQSVSACTGISQQTILNAEFVFYPNPTAGTVTIKAKAGLQIQVYNIIGELILSSELKTEITEISLNDQADGIYFIKAGTVTKKIIKQ